MHRLAVQRGRAPGLGAEILRWAADIVRDQGRDLLRLDCVASNGQLRGYYVSAGFAYQGDATVRGAPGQWVDDGPAIVVSLFELKLMKL